MVAGQYNIKAYSVESGSAHIRDRSEHRPSRGLFRQTRLGVKIAEQSDGSFLLTLGKGQKKSKVVQYGGWHQRRAVLTQAELSPEAPTTRIWPHNLFAEFLIASQRITRKITLTSST